MTNTFLLRTLCDLLRMILTKDGGPFNDLLVYQNNKTADILVYQTNPVGVVTLFSYVKTSSCSNKFCMAAGHMSENALLE